MELGRTEMPDHVASDPIDLKMLSSLPLDMVLACFDLLGRFHSLDSVCALQYRPASSGDTVPFSDAFQHDYHKFHISNKLTYHILYMEYVKENSNVSGIPFPDSNSDCILFHF